MKLHRIRVTNLNSLYGEQQLDLDGDLHGASLFLIQGPTGSGKSTLMDAVSLALFGTTPRLVALRSEKDVAEQVMSRGTGVAIAELEFSKWSTGGGGRERYRATWKARRSREKPDGNMQDTERSMERLQADGTWALEVGSKRAKDYAPVFAAVLEGFTPSDFQRSMLLAQGQFDAMLHAKPEERAAILERLTDTGDYQRLGERAARMWGAWKRRLDQRQSKRDAIAPLSGEELATAQHALATADERMKSLEAERVLRQAELDWLTRRATLQGDLVTAREEVAVVAARREAAADRLAALEAHEACGDAFTALDRSVDADEALELHREIQRQLAESLPALEEAVARANEALERASASHEAGAKALEDLREPATRATSARSQLDQARGEAKKARTALQAASARHEAAGRTVQQATEARRKAEVALESASESLADQRGGEAVYQALPGLQSQGTALRARQEALGRGRDEVQRRTPKLAAEEAALVTARQAHQTAWEATVGPQQQAADDARQALRELAGTEDPDALAADLRQRMEVAQQHREALQGVQVALLDVAERQGEHEVRREALEQARVSHQQAVEAQSLAAEDVALTKEQVTVAQAQLAPLQRIADLGAQRLVLEEGEPCPLCGSGEHPYVHDPAQRVQAEAIEAEVATAQRALTQARQAQDAAERSHTQAVAAVSAAASGVQRAQAEALGAQQALTASQGRSRLALDAAGYVVGLGLDALAAEQTKAEDQRDALRERLQALEGARTRERQATDALAAAEKHHAAEATRLTQEAARLQQARRDLDLRSEELADDATVVERLAGQLDDALAAVGITGPEGLDQAKSRAAAWHQAHQAHAAAVVDHDKAVAAHAAATEALGQVEEVRDGAAKDLDQREGALGVAQRAADEAGTEWAEVWSRAADLDAPGALPRPSLDRPPSELVAFQADRVALLDEARTAARRARDQASEAHTGAVSRQATLAETEVQLQATAAERRKAVDAHLEALSLPDIAALRALRLDPDALSSTRDLREGLTTARTVAQARSRTITQQLERHHEGRPDTLADGATVEVLTESLTALAEVRSQAQSELDGARATVEMAARDQAALAQAQAALEADQRASALWEELNKLIGVGEGKRFKLFAQALNLDQLLVRANRHLEQLNDRYHLSSVPDPDTGLPSLDFEVSDRWRPGTTRSLKTLSGGESFLVSLALALGLSDLRTSSMPVETLLLDEGFGTLDPSTLDTALAALQQLQATGRQVGLISHVVGLQERIEARVRVEPLGEGRSRVRVDPSRRAMPGSPGPTVPAG